MTTSVEHGAEGENRGEGVDGGDYKQVGLVLHKVQTSKTIIPCNKRNYIEQHEERK